MTKHLQKKLKMTKLKMTKFAASLTFEAAYNNTKCLPVKIGY